MNRAGFSTGAMLGLSCIVFKGIRISPKQGRRQVKICGVDRHGERGARAYNGVWGVKSEP